MNIKVFCFENMGRDKMKFSLPFLFFQLLFFSCNKFSAELPDKNIISENEAKEIVAKEIAESDYYQQYYVLDSEKFDNRVYDITWGETILVNVVPDGKIFKKETKYYILNGTLPSGQVLAAQTVDAYTGELLDGVSLLEEGSDELKIISKDEAENYMSRLAYNTKNIEVVYYYDGTGYTIDPIFCWKYCINTKSSRSLFNNTSKLSDFVFIDPWQSLKDKSIDISNENSFFSKFNYNHRAYRISSSVENENYRSLNSKKNINFEPVD